MLNSKTCSGLTMSMKNKNDQINKSKSAYLKRGLRGGPSVRGWGIR